MSGIFHLLSKHSKHFPNTHQKQVVIYTTLLLSVIWSKRKVSSTIRSEGKVLILLTQERGTLLRSIQNTDIRNYSALGSRWVPIFLLGFYVLIFIPSCTYHLLFKNKCSKHLKHLFLDSEQKNQKEFFLCTIFGSSLGALMHSFTPSLCHYWTSLLNCLLIIV